MSAVSPRVDACVSQSLKTYVVARVSAYEKRDEFREWSFSVSSAFEKWQGTVSCPCVTPDTRYKRVVFRFYLDSILETFLYYPFQKK